MTHKRTTLYGKEARKKLLLGVDAVADPVKATMGAKGRVVITSTGHVTKDGVTVARDIDFSHDPHAAQGAKMIQSASIRSCDVAGDGTTATAVLTQSIIHNGFALIEEGKDAQELKRELESAKDLVKVELKKLAVETKDILAIACVSANDPEVGKVVKEAVDAVGVNGVVTIENTYDETEIVVVDGMQIEQGFNTGIFSTRTDKPIADLDDPVIIITNYKMHDVAGLQSVLEVVLDKYKKPIVLIANGYEDPVYRTLEQTVFLNKGMVKLLPINAPHLLHDETLEDLAALTGATIITEADGLASFQLDMLGSVKNVISTPEATIFRPHDTQKPVIEAQTKKITEESKGIKESHKKEYADRIARLNGKMAIIKWKVTGTDANQKEVRDRIEDAIFASQAALEMGIVAGGGKTYIDAAKAITDDTEGSQILRKALEAPVRQILKNAGKNDSDILRHIKESDKGYNVLTDEYEDFMKTGIVDPLKVLLTAIENAVNVAGLVLITECVSATITIED